MQIFAGRVPKRAAMASTAPAAMRAAVPRQPACTAATAHGALIHQQDGNAVGGLDGDHAAGLVFEQRVALAQDAGASFGGHAR